MKCGRCGDVYYVLGEDCEYDPIDNAYCPMCGEPLIEPKSLTLNELRERDGMPVWVVTKEGFIQPQWLLVNAKTEKLVGAGMLYWKLEDLENECYAYDRPPKEG